MKKEELEEKIRELDNAIEFIPSYIKKTSTLYGFYMVRLEKYKKEREKLCRKLMNMRKK